MQRVSLSGLASRCTTMTSSTSSAHHHQHLVLVASSMRGLCSTAPLLGYRPVTNADRPVQHVISRTRTWRGIMQVAPASATIDTKTAVYNVFFFLPFQIGVGLLLTAAAYYFVAGHDQFLFEVCGYESEMQYEGAVNPRTGTLTPGILATMDKGQMSPLRDLEKPLHPAPSFPDQTFSHQARSKSTQYP